MDTSNQFNTCRFINWHGWLPSRGNVLFTLLVAGCFVYALKVGASIPLTIVPTTSVNTLAYQGRLANPNGTPLNGSYDMTFHLYNIATGGNALWTETWTGVQVNQGLFNVLLGSQSTISSNIMTDNSTLWLGIAIGNDSEMTPRIQLGSSPFAMTVKDNSITSNKLALTYDGYATWLPLQQVIGPGWEEINVGSYHPLTVTVDVPSLLDISVTASLHTATANTRAAFRVMVDGTEKGYAVTTTPVSLSTRLLVPVEVGSHSIHVDIGTWDIATIGIDSAFALNVIVLGLPE